MRSVKNINTAVWLAATALIATLWFVKQSGKLSGNPPETNASFFPTSNQNRHELPKTIQSANLTQEQKIALKNAFIKKFRPAAERWCKAFEGRIPFKPEDVTLNKFHSASDDGLYTFMIGSTTLVFDDKGDSARVMYMMTAEGAKKLNSIPNNGQPPDISVPLKSEDILRMVRTESGIDYKPNQVQITPSGAGTALSGGAMVSVNQHTIDGSEVLDGKSYHMVFDMNGKLVNYEGPFL